VERVEPKVPSPVAMKYLEFLAYCDQVLSKHKLSTTEFKILRAVTQKSLNGETLWVQNLLDMKEIASSATIHKAMKKLIKKKLIAFNPDKTDDRVKYLVPTPLAVAMFVEFGEQLRHQY
jgi:DNA-binding MarR family transcriptional regulator